ncbi:hypothetical protein STA3757_43440 [Stanieria sp. NIES-3757]|nr:hypothetical protein STA3757_43440 [Stanieria sp. NIES-3757]
MPSFSAITPKLLTIFLLILTLKIDLGFSDKTSNLSKNQWLEQIQTGKVVKSQF